MWCEKLYFDKSKINIEMIFFGFFYKVFAFCNIIVSCYFIQIFSSVKITVLPDKI